MSVLRKSSLWDCWSLRPVFHIHMQFLFDCLGIGSLHYWYSNQITTMQRQLVHSQAMTHNSKFGQWLTHHKISGCLHTRRTIDYRRGNITISCLYQRKVHRYWIKMYELCDTKNGYIYNLEVCTVAHPTNPEHNKVFSVVGRLCDKREGSLCVHG
jgi:hypothetical protein